MPQASGDAISSGSWNKVPVVVGNTRWEQKLQNQQYADITAEEYEAMVIDQFGETAGRAVLEEYPASDYELPFYALAAVRTVTTYDHADVQITVDDETQPAIAPNPVRVPRREEQLSRRGRSAPPQQHNDVPGR